VTWAYGVFVLDLEPQGPLPTQIYWRRRALALAVAVVAIGAVVAVVVTVLTGNADADTKSKPAAEATAQAAPPNSQPNPQPEVNSPITTLPPAAQTPTAATAVAPPPVLKDGDDCPDSTLAVKGITSQPQYVFGEQPKFTMVVTNIGLVACQRDVGAAVLAAYVYSLDTTRLWSNLDCAPSNETLVKKFSPGEQVTTEVTWTGMSSAPGCPLPRQPIGAGTYTLVVQLGNLRSAPVPFIIAEPAPVAESPAAGQPEGVPPVEAPPAG
jgi:hypothetical protein